MSTIGDRPIDCVFGGAPCQGFSLIGQRAIDDPRNSLVRDFVRLVKELDAKSFVFENVKGLTVGNHRKFLDELVIEFTEAGYACRLPWQILNAANFGTPQSRERLILMGAKQGTTPPKYPSRSTSIAGKEAELTIPIGPTCMDAIGDLPNADQFSELTETDEVEALLLSSYSDYAAEMRCLTNSCWHYGYVREWDRSLVTSSATTKHTDISRRRFAETKQGEVEPISRFLRLPASGVANTLRAGTDGARGAFTSPRPIHFEHARCITVREMARLHGFPDWFRMHRTKWHGARQIGNAVPPPLARAVGREIIVALGSEVSKPTQALNLGNAALLGMDLTQSARFFNVVRPQNRRTLKSGNKKRKQSDIEASRSTPH